MCALPLSIFIAEAGFELMQPESRVGSTFWSTTLQTDSSTWLRNMTLGSSAHSLTILRTEFGFHWLIKMVNFCVTLSGHRVTLVQLCPG